MSDPAGTHSLLAWLRRGLSTSIGAVDDGSPSGARATASISLSVGGGPLSAAEDPLVTELALHGPGDVRALDARVVVRTWPRPDVFEAEPNYFPLIELTPADLPWRYTPARANAASRLRPWLCLAVLRDDEIEAWSRPTAQRPVATVKVHSGASLPPLAQAYAWAHVQVSGTSHADEALALELLETEPHRLVARLLCPRKLTPRTAYTAVLVPALERARLRGLNQTVPDSVDGLAPAWSPTSTGLELPVYYQWRFQTADSGDFEALVRRIQPRPTPSTLGTRPIDVSTPGLGLPAAASTPLLVESALAAISSSPGSWDPAERAAFRGPLVELLNLPDTLLSAAAPERIVAPPLYGQWHALRTRLDATAEPWFDEVNTDPRLRVVAGVGAEVVRRGREALLASAWQQVDGIRAANELLRHAQLAREASLSLFGRHVTPLSVESFLGFTAPLHARVKASPTTIRAVLAQSPLATGVLHPAFRRVLRARGPLGVRTGRSAPNSRLLARLNRGELEVAPVPALPSVLATPARAGAGLAPSWVENRVVRWLSERSALELLAIAAGLLLLAALLALFGAVAPAVALTALAGLLLGYLAFGRSRLVALVEATAVRDDTLTPADVRNAPPRPGFVPTEIVGTPPLAGKSSGSEHPSVALFRNAMTDVIADFRAPLRPGPVRVSADLTTLRQKLVTALDPRTTIPAAARARLTLSSKLGWQPLDPIEPIMAAPVFPQAMYLPLEDVSTDWLFAGLDQVPQDTVTLLRTNQRLIETFMLGLNHEMARVLLFNEYPTDQRGSYFRQFWDSSSVPLPPGTDVETTKDIRPLHTWANTELGTHSPRAVPPGGDFLVLLVRAELMRRYPNVVVYAARARWKSDGSRELVEQEEAQPVFRGTLGAGVGFWGFGLTVAEVRGGERPTDDPGWFFVLQEHADETRFGLDVAGAFGGAPTSWDDLSWSSLAADRAALDALDFIDLNAELPDTRAVTNSGGAAWHGDSGLGPHGATAADLGAITFQRPVRVAVHASRLLPP